MCPPPDVQPITAVADAVAVAAAVARVQPPSHPAHPPPEKFPRHRKRLNQTPHPPRRWIMPTTPSMRLILAVISANHMPKRRLILPPTRRNPLKLTTPNLGQKYTLRRNRPKLLKHHHVSSRAIAAQKNAGPNAGRNHSAPNRGSSPPIFAPLKPRPSARPLSTPRKWPRRSSK